MELLKQSKPQCLLYSFAMVMEEEPRLLLQSIGHDGLEEWWPQCKGLARYRGHHPQELIDCAITLGYAVITIEPDPSFTTATGSEERSIFDINQVEERITSYMIRFDGVLSGTYRGLPHATAWCSEERKCYDPNGFVHAGNDFTIMEFFAIVKL